MTSDKVAFITDSIKLLVKKAMTSGTLCQTFVDRARVLNVTFLETPSGIAESGALCKEAPTFTTIISGSTDQPSTQPSSAPSTQPHIRRKKLITSGFIGFLTIVGLIWFLRFYPSIVGIFVKKEKKVGHLYDILVVISEDEEAILENIRHQDIAFFRATNKDESDELPEWTMNTNSDCLEKRFEVQFLDHYDLLGQSGPAEDDEHAAVGHSITGDKLVTKDSYVHQVGLQMGMIISVKPAAEDDDDDDDGPRQTQNEDQSQRSDLDSTNSKPAQMSFFSRRSAGSANPLHREVSGISTVSSISDMPTPTR